MSINYTVTEVTKEFIKVKYQDDREVLILVKTWYNKDWIEATIQQKYDEIDEGSVDDIPVKVGDTGTIPTIQELNKARKEEIAKIEETSASYTFDYQLMRRVSYPFINDSVGALIKAVLTGDKTELESLNTIIEEIKTKYPKDDTKYTREQLMDQKQKSPVTNHFPDGYLRNGVRPVFINAPTDL